jgi:sulfate transport system substrate-binding protein
LLAEYGSALTDGADPRAAKEQLRAIWQHVHLMAPSARSALTLFELGAGDFLITYEQDALLAQARGVPLEIVIPTSTILAQPVAVLVEANLTRAERAVAQAFLDFLVSPEGQQILENYHLRQPDGQSTQLPAIQHSFTVENLGSWQQAYDLLIAGFWQSEIAPQLDLEPVAPLLAPGDD